MAMQMNDEFMYLNNRMKQKLLYQIGLIDDPWMADQGFIMDDEYSQDLNKPFDVENKRRTKSAGGSPKNLKETD